MWFFQVLVNVLVLFIVKQVISARNTIVVRPPCFLTKRPQIPLVNIVLATTSAFFTLIFLELILQGFYKPLLVISGWKSFCSELERNQFGFRGQSIEYSDNDFVIVLLEDSQVEAHACSYWWIPGRWLQKHLNAFDKHVKVFTLGTSGYGQDQQLLVLREYYKTYRADMVILWQSPANDIWNNMFPTHWSANGIPEPTFWLENGELQGPSEQLGKPLQTSLIKLIELWRRAFAPVRQDKVWEQFFPQPYTPLTDYDGPINQECQEEWNAGLGLMRDKNLDNEESHFAIFLTPPSERMKYSLELTRKLLQEIETLVNSHNGEFVIFYRRGRHPSTKTSAKEEVYVLHDKYYRYSLEQAEKNIEYSSFRKIFIDTDISGVWA